MLPRDREVPLSNNFLVEENVLTPETPSVNVTESFTNQSLHIFVKVHHIFFNIFTLLLALDHNTSMLIIVTMAYWSESSNISV